MNNPVRILYVDDYPLDRELVRDALEKEHSGFAVTEAATRADFESKLAQGSFDLILSDFNILGFEGLQVLDAVRTKDSTLPVIIVTGTGSEEIAAEAIKRGAADYVIKTPKHIQRLPYTIHFVLEKKRLEAEHRQMEESLRESEERFRNLLNVSPIGIAVYSEGKIVFTNPAGQKLLGAESVDQLIGKPISEIIHPQGFGLARNRIQRMMEGEKGLYPVEDVYVRLDGTSINVEVMASLFIFKGKPAVQVIITDITERKRAETALKEQELLLRRVLEKLPVGVWLTDATGVIIKGNEVGQRIWAGFRYVGIEQYGEYKGWWANSGKRIKPEEWAAARAISKGETSLDEEINIECFDGTQKTILNSALPIRDTNQQITGAIVINQDITERKQAEEALRQSEEKYRFLFAHSPQIMWIYDLETLAFLEVNQAAIHHYGYSREEFLAMTLADIRPAEDVPALLKDVEVTSRTYNFAGVWRHLKKNGEIIFVEIISHSLVFNNRPARNVLVTDITERKQAEAQLRLQSAALNATANAMVITDQTGLIQWVNPAFGELTGYTPAETIGQNLRELVKSGQHDQAFYQNLWNTILSGQVWRGEIVNRRKDGSLYTEEQTITPVRDAQGKISHFIAIKQNISPRKALEAENQKLTEQFYQAQKMDSIGQLAGGIAHDFNNLLVPIVGYAELGMMIAPPNGKLYTHFEQIKEAGNRAAGLTRQILAFSRKQELEMTMVDLNRVIREFEKMLGRLIGENISLKTYLSPDLPAIKADQGQLEQVLLNLAVNARDAMPEGGKLTIETAQVVLDEAYAAGHVGTQPGVYVQLAVNDTGCGMDAATQQRIFEPFFTTKARGHGTGLGLSTAFGIIKQHGGNIWVYSEPKQGTTFKLYLPVAESAMPTILPEQPTAWMLQGTETILVVEDEAGVRQLVSNTLHEYGYRVIEAGDPTDGMVLASTYLGSVDLLLTDVMMPVMTGWELFQRLVKDRPELRVLYMSGYTNNLIGSHGMPSDRTAFLQKPFTINGLLEKVRMVLDK